MSDRPDVLVVGAGVVGLACARALAGAGAVVEVVEAGPDAAASASAGNAGLITPSHGIPLARPEVVRSLPKMVLDTRAPVRVRPRPSLAMARFGARLLLASRPRAVGHGLEVLGQLGRDSAAQFRALSEQLSFGYTPAGLFNVCMTDHGLSALRDDAERLASVGVRSEVLDGAQTHRRAPWISPSVAGAVFWPDDAHCDPALLTSALTGEARAAGVRFCFSTRVLGIEAQGARVAAVHTTRGTLRPQQVVVAAGAQTAPLAAGLGRALPLQAAKGYHVEVPGTIGHAHAPAVFHEQAFAVTQLSGRVRVAGTMEFGADAVPDRRRALAMFESAGPYLQAPMAFGERHSIWSGMRPCLPDGLPVIGRSRRITNAIFATGHGTLGLTLAPATGQLVADISGGRGGDSQLLGALSPARFGV